jgi:hypothetical protein
VLLSLLNRSVTITRSLPSTEANAYGDEVPDTDEIETVGELQQQQRSEPGGEGELSATRWLLILPAGTDVRTGDSVEVDGATYELTGDPWPARNPLTQADSHVEATVVRTAGSEEQS